jgi:hypothetical protein
MGVRLLLSLEVVKELIIEGESISEVRAVITKFPEGIRESLKRLGLVDWRIVGLSTLEILGLTPNTSSGRLEEGWCTSFLNIALFTKP